MAGEAVGEEHLVDAVLLVVMAQPKRVQRRPTMVRSSVE
jgi:hypothetical protein